MFQIWEVWLQIRKNAYFFVSEKKGNIFNIFCNNITFRSVLCFNIAILSIQFLFVIFNHIFILINKIYFKVCVTFQSKFMLYVVSYFSRPSVKAFWKPSFSVTSHLYKSQLYDFLCYTLKSLGSVHALQKIMLNFAQLY